MKRFYSDAGYEAAQGQFQVTLDGRPVRTPAKAMLRVPSQKLAAAIAAEWQAQPDTINPATMPLMQIASTTIDRVSQARGEIMRECLAYLHSDLVCYRAQKADLAAEQARLWDEPLSWFAAHYGALAVTDAISPLTQPADIERKVEAALDGLDTYRFTVLQIVCATTGSLVLALAFTSGAMPPQAVFEAALCEELFFERTMNLAQYGPDPAAGPKRDALLAELEACRACLGLL